MSRCSWKLACVATRADYPGDELRYRSEAGGLLEVVHDLQRINAGDWREELGRRRMSQESADRSGVWRFRELVLPVQPEEAVSRGEGNTTLYDVQSLADQVGLDRLLLKHEGENPTGSFKDRGMAVGVTMARRLGVQKVACASTGNTAASMASYAAFAGMTAYVFIPEGNIAFGKLSQALGYGARTLQIAGDFDDAMQLVEEICRREDIYLLNSLNPFRLEGQKTIAFELLQDLEWEPPDWIVLPGGNLGNVSAIFKALRELRELGLIDRYPRLAVIQAEGASPLYEAYQPGGAFDRSADLEPVAGPQTIASAIRIGAPVSWPKARQAIDATDGIVDVVTDQQIMDAKAWVDSAGIGSEPASCASVAGTHKLVASGLIASDASVVCILTGHVLKDPDATTNYHLSCLDGICSNHANAPVSCDADVDAILQAL